MQKLPRRHTDLFYLVLFLAVAVFLIVLHARETVSYTVVVLFHFSIFLSFIWRATAHTMRTRTMERYTFVLTNGLYVNDTTSSYKTPFEPFVRHTQELTVEGAAIICHCSSYMHVTLSTALTSWKQLHLIRCRVV